VQKTSGRGSLLLKGIYMAHDIVAPDPLFFGNDLEGLVADDEMLANVLERGVRDLGEPHLLFGLGQPEPQSSPLRSALSRRENLLHLCAYIDSIRTDGWGGASGDYIWTYSHNASSAGFDTRH